MRIVFFGTPEETLPLINTLHKTYMRKGESPIVAVVTQPPKPVGRRKVLAYSAVDSWAHKKKIRVHYGFADLLKDPTLVFDIGVLAAYGKIVPEELIRKFKYGILNIHPSMLPKYRGASPVQAAIANGDKVTGVSIIKLTKKLDAGPVLAKAKEEINKDDTLKSLTKRLFYKGSVVLTEMLPAYIQGKITPKPQNESKATYTKILTRKDGRVDLKKSNPAQIERLIRAYHPWPGVWTNVKLKIKNSKFMIKRLKILKAHLEKEGLILDLVQLEGKNPVSWEQFRLAYGKDESYALPDAITEA